ncbi:MAG: DivIVA domain-containing protein, partial [Acidobacteria bacterium]|nr:DivIVA domain-containing protein [Acidobacteriota bacterium]
MKLTPLDIHTRRFPVKFRGYDPEEVRSFLQSVSEEFERIVVDNHQLKEELTRVKNHLEDFQQREKILKDTLYTTQKLCEQMREEARREQKILMQEAEHRAGVLMEQAQRKVLEIQRQILEMRTERDVFEQKIRMTVEQHLKLLDLRKAESELQDRIRLMKGRAAQA